MDIMIMTNLELVSTEKATPLFRTQQYIYKSNNYSTQVT